MVVALLARLAEEPAQPKTLSRDTGTSDGLDFVVLLVFAGLVLLLSHEGSSAETRCMMTAPGPYSDLDLQGERWLSAATGCLTSKQKRCESCPAQLSGGNGRWKPDSKSFRWRRSDEAVGLCFGVLWFAPAEADFPGLEKWRRSPKKRMANG